MKDCLGLVETLQKKVVSLTAINQGLTFDNSTYSKFSLTLLAALAELGSSIRSQRIKAGLANPTKRLGKKPHPKTAELRRLRKRGVKVREIAEKFGLTRAGVYWISRL